MENCKKCNVEIPAGANYCPGCGRALFNRSVNNRSTKKRGNGQGTVFKLNNGKYMAQVTLGYYTDEQGKRHRRTRSKVYALKKDAVAALATLGEDPRKAVKKAITFRELYNAWLPTHRAEKDTINCYKAAFKHFSAVHFMPIMDIDVDDLQECLDDCPAGKRTRQNMKTLVGLMYKYGIPRKAIPDNLNLGPFLIVSGEASAHRSGFNEEEIGKIKAACGKVPYAEEIYIMIYTGFRPSEFLALTAADYDAKQETITGGAKTEAGRGRVVTLSPKVKRLVARCGASEGALWRDKDGKPWASLKDYTEKAFYPALDAIGIDNPILDMPGGIKRHRLTPHSCRHTFATLLKRAAGADKDKMELIGHASPEMLRYYQDVELDDLRKITDKI